MSSRAQTNVKVTTYNPITKETHMEHKPYRSEVFYPKSGTTEKTKSD